MTKTKPVRVSQILLTCIFIAGASYTISAQVPGVNSSDLRREENLRRIETDAHATAKNRAAKDVLAEVNEDMGRLNALNEIIGAALAANTPLDYIGFSERAAEIKARSIRLKTNLSLPADEKAEKHDVLKGVDMTSLPPSLSVLNKLVTSFTHNPIFSDTGGLDVQLAVKARQDLDDIIIVSEKVRKTAEKLKKAKP